MNRTNGLSARPVPLIAALAAVFALVVTLGPMAGPASAVHLTQFPGEPGTIVEHSGDGLVETYRFNGRDRLDTAALIATDPDPEVRGTPGAQNADQDAYFLDSNTVLLARADLFPDSLSGNYLAGVADGPILLTASDTLSDVAREALSDIGPDNVIVLGGEAAISPAVVEELEAEGYDVERFGGSDRFGTAIDIAEAGGEVNQLNGLRTAIVASGVNFPDAVVAGGLAFSAGFPLLLSTQAELEPQTAQALEDLQIEQVVIPGGPVALSDAVESEIEEITGNDVIRRSGDDRVETAIDIARFAVDELDFTLEHVNVARGDVFPDSLTIGPHAGAEGAVLLLSANNTTLDGDGDAVASFLEDAGCELGFVHLAGGFQALTEEVEQELREAATREGETCEVELTPETATNRVNEPHTVTATVTDNGGGVPDDTTTVTFTVTSETGTAGSPATEEVETDEDGTAEFQFNSQSAGTFRIEGCVDATGGAEVCDTVTKTYEGGASETATASPSPSPSPSPSASTSENPQPEPGGIQNPDGPRPADPANAFDSPIGSDSQVVLVYGEAITCGPNAAAQFTYSDENGSENVPATEVMCGAGGDPSGSDEEIAVRFEDGVLQGSNTARQEGTLTYTQSSNAADRVKNEAMEEARSPVSVTVNCCGILIG